MAKEKTSYYRESVQILKQQVVIRSPHGEMVIWIEDYRSAGSIVMKDAEGNTNTCIDAAGLYVSSPNRGESPALAGTAISVFLGCIAHGSQADRTSIVPCMHPNKSMIPHMPLQHHTIHNILSLTFSLLSDMVTKHHIVPCKRFPVNGIRANGDMFPRTGSLDAIYANIALDRNFGRSLRIDQNGAIHRHQPHQEIMPGKIRSIWSDGTFNFNLNWSKKQWQKRSQQSKKPHDNPVEAFFNGTRYAERLSWADCTLRIFYAHDWGLTVNTSDGNIYAFTPDKQIRVTGSGAIEIRARSTKGVVRHSYAVPAVNDVHGEDVQYYVHNTQYQSWRRWRRDAHEARARPHIEARKSKVM